VLGEGPDVTPVKVLNCDTITQVRLLLRQGTLVTMSSSLLVYFCAVFSMFRVAGEREDHRPGVQEPAVLPEAEGGERRFG